ncbi:PDZ domain-containing protein [Weissella uvarum]|uniref:SepM family pheromone-processing serine protease n=1 Tax=Weissella uvarum TaxID=1479233 RepID=UPI0019612630|nr:SepM family pheromone-processing serine protease [Weissella uvarum]MBM7617519.1 PDZ domain-containing protein [Weissella uvarum]MCM0595597.1 PDZ domain-containing protein [Weissella uvarum]
MLKRFWSFIKRHRVVVISMAVVLFVVGMVWPLPLYAERPGTAADLANYIKVDKKKPKLNGDFMLTSVAIMPLNGVTLIWNLFDPHATIETKSAALGGSASEQDDQKINKIYMKTSINEAKANAYKAAKVPYQRDFHGIYVMAIQPNSHFKKKLQVGDTIESINQKHYQSAQAFQKTIRKQKVGTNLTVGYRHNQKQKEATAKTVALAGTKDVSGIGIILTDDVDVKSKRPVSADLGDIGGPSGGLMFALEMYDALSPVDLANGRQIAGTGSIDKNGRVGEIGGIDKKVIAAHEAGVKIFLAPYVKPTKENLKYEEDGQTNYQLAKKTAKKYAPDMKVIPVSTFNEAIDKLQK